MNKLTKKDYDDIIEWANEELFQWQKFIYKLKQKYPQYASNPKKHKKTTRK